MGRVARQLAAVVLVFALLAGAPADTRAAASCPPTATVTRVRPTGDSIAMGAKAVAPRPWNGWRKPLRDKLTAERYAVDLVGLSEEGTPDFADRQFAGWAGWSIEMIRAEIVDWVSDFHPSAILLMAGTNDMFLGKDPPPSYPWNAGERMETLLELIHQTDPCIVVVVSEIPPIWGPAPGVNPAADAASPWVQPFNDALPGIVSRRQAAGQRIVLQSIDGIQGDGLHLLAEEDEEIADRWYASLRSFSGLLMRTPAAPHPINPNGTLTTRRPTFRWDELDDPVNEYALYDAGPNGQYDLVRTYKPSEICGTICEAEAPFNLQDGPHTYWLIAWNGAGWGYWSEAHHYCITTCTVTRPPAPLVSLNASNTVFHWTSTAGAAIDGWAVYDAVFNPDGTMSYDLVRTVDGHDPCSGGACSFAWPSPPSPGWHQAWVIGWNAAGWGSWSEGYVYCVCQARASEARALPSPSPSPSPSPRSS